MSGGKRDNDRDLETFRRVMVTIATGCLVAGKDKEYFLQLMLELAAEAYDVTAEVQSYKMN